MADHKGIKVRWSEELIVETSFWQQTVVFVFQISDWYFQSFYRRKLRNIGFIVDAPGFLCGSEDLLST
jgi:hypothetical protein